MHLADERLGAVAHALQKEQVHAIDIHDDGVCRDIELVAVHEKEFVEDNRDDLRAQQHPERREPYAGYSAQICRGQREYAAAECADFPDQVDGAGEHGDDLPQPRCERRAEDALSQPLNEKPVKEYVGDESRRHRRHRAERSAEIAQERHATRGENLHRRKAREHEDVGVGITVDDAFRAEDVDEIRINAHKHRRHRHACEQKIGERVAEIPLFGADIAASARHGQHDGAAHAYARPHGVYERDERICDIDCGKPFVADIVPHEKAVHDGVKPRERKRHH